MQTFLPYQSFTASARVLDNRRLGKQRVETLQILRTLHGLSRGWRSHPAVLMWVGHDGALGEYGRIICNEWKLRGFADTCEDKIAQLTPAGTVVLPHWLGDECLHESHRSNLIAKDRAYYFPLFRGNTREGLPYIWPRISVNVGAWTNLI